MKDLITALGPEIFLSAVACLLFLVGTMTGRLSRQIAGEAALVALFAVFLVQCYRVAVPQGVVALLATNGADPAYVDTAIVDAGGAVHVHAFAQFVKLIASGVGALLVMLNRPTNADRTGTSASDTGTDTSEFFALLLLSITGLMLVASANDLTLLFLGIELASIPTYIMVSISRPLPVAQEAGLKYFFLGAMSAAIMLFGFSYLYGVTGTTSLDAIRDQMARNPTFTPWLVLATLLLIGGFAFKMAAVPLHSYAGDVYQGAATPVTAVLSFVPKVAGFVALIKVLFAVGGGQYAVPESVVTVLKWIAGLTMTVGNLLALRQSSQVKRVMAYSSVAHSGYMLVGVTALVAAAGHEGAGAIQQAAVQGILFYLATYGLMNVAAFGVLQLLPTRHPKPATSAETLEDLAGQGRKHVGLGLAMAVACLALAGVPLTTGFLGKVYLTVPAGQSNLVVLSVVLWVNAAISAAYYLRLIATMFLRPEATHTFGVPTAPPAALPPQRGITMAVMIAAVATVVLGVPPLHRLLTGPTRAAAALDPPPILMPAAEPVPTALTDARP